MANVAVQITFTMDGEQKRILLDTINDVEVSLNSTITTHPLVNGDIVADHMYKEPISMNISGAFSLNGSPGFITSSAGSKLTNAQKLFERIKDEAILCDIVKMDTRYKSGDIKFQSRTNMVLTSISWTERINNVGFNFGFTQALLVEVKPAKSDSNDTSLPNINAPVAMNFTDALIDWDYIYQTLTSTMVAKGIMSEKFLEKQKAYGKAGLAAIAGGTTVGVIALIIGASAATAGIAAIVGAVAVFAIGVANAIKRISESSKYTVKQFRLYADDEKNRRETQRYVNFVGNVYKQISILNESVRCWQISSNNDHYATVLIDNEYYTFNFIRNNITLDHKVFITDVNNVTVGQVNHMSSSPDSFMDCYSNNALFRVAGSGTYVYLLRTPDTNSKYLPNYYIVSTTFKPEEFNQIITDIIVDALTR